MALRGKKPEQVKTRLKAFFYGKAKVGKTTAAIQFVKPYLIDTEGGAIHKKYKDILRKQEGVIFETNDCDEIINEVKALLTTKHDYKTLVIDSLTTVYNDLVDKYEEIVGTEYGKHFNAANKKMKHLYNLLARLDMNVIITSHAKNEYGDNMKVIEQTFDCYKKLDYLFDLIIEIQKQAKKRYGFIKGTRLEGFEEGDRFEFSYEEILKRYDKESLEREAISETLATKEQIFEINRLTNLLKVNPEIIDKWLDKAKATTWEEMPETHIVKCIDYLKKQITSNNEDSTNVVNL